MGYRIDFGSKKVVQTGGFYFKVLPKNVQILIDGIIKKKTDIFFGSILIKNLLPKEYEVKIEKEGYFPWEKNLKIEERVVTEAKNIVLVPEKTKFEVFKEGVENFFFSPDGKKIILKEKEGIKFFDTERKIKNYPVENLKIEEIVFSSDSQKILLKTDSKFKLLDLTKFPPSSILLDFLDPEIQEITFHPKDFQKIFFLKNGEIFQADLEKKETILFEKDILTYKILGGNIYFLANSGFLFKSDSSQKIKEKVNETVFPAKEGANYQLEIFGNFIFLKDGETLYLFDPDSSSFEKFFEPLKSLKISPDLKKIAFFNDHEIWLFYFEDSFDQPWKKVKEKVFLTRFSEKIGDLFWFTAHYLIFNTDSTIKIVEIDDRDGLNIYDLAESKESKIFFDDFDKKVYLLSEGNLYISEKLLP